MANEMNSSSVNLDVFTLQDDCNGNNLDTLQRPNQVDVGGRTSAINVEVHPSGNGPTDRNARISLRIAAFGRKAGQRTKIFLVGLRSSVTRHLPSSTSDSKSWIHFLQAAIFLLLVAFGLAAFLLSLVEQSDLRYIRDNEPILMIDTWTSLTDACVVVLVSATLVVLSGVLGLWGFLSRSRLIISVHFLLLTISLLPMLYQGFGNDIVNGLSETNSKSYHTLLRAKHDIRHNYGFDIGCTSNDGNDGDCITSKWDKIQQNRQCCGISPQGSRIYVHSKWYKNMTESLNSANAGVENRTTTVPLVPLSCCVTSASGEVLDKARCQTTENEDESQGARYLQACDEAQAGNFRTVQLRLSVVSFAIALIISLIIVVTFVRFLPQEL